MIESVALDPGIRAAADRASSRPGRPPGPGWRPGSRDYNHHRRHFSALGRDPPGRLRAGAGQEGRRVRAARPLRGPGSEGGGFAAAHLTERAAALGPGDAPREGTGPPLSVKAGCDRRATANRPAAWHRHTPSPALTLSLRRPQGQEKRAGRKGPTLGAARPVTTGSAHQRTSGKPSELAFDSQKNGRNHKNPLTGKCSRFQGIAAGKRIPAAWPLGGPSSQE